MSQKAIYVLLADGFETLEALAPVDVFRRAAYPVYTVSTEGKAIQTSAQGVPVRCDQSLDDLPDPTEIALVYIPGGMGGAESLSRNEKVLELLRAVNQAGGLIAAICAGPMVLAAAGLSQSRRGTCFPGCEKLAQFMQNQDEAVVYDRGVYSSRGPATAADYALTLLRRLAGAEAADRVHEDMQFSYLKKAIRDGKL